MRNVSSVFNTIERNPGITRSRITQKTGLSMMTVSKIIDTFARKGVIIQYKSEGSSSVQQSSDKTVVAGRKASLTNSFCEVSLNAYGVFTHRHRPEISHHLGVPVLFQPHLGNFKRGILATIYVELEDGVTDEMIDETYHNSYDNVKIVRLVNKWPSIKDVEFTPFCDIHYQREGNMLVICSAIDNLQKGAAAHAMQCINIRFGFDVTTSLL
jgi:N-acetyl-gamma-glutamyl-phosphate reductase